MLTKLFVFTKAVHWSVLAGAVTFGGVFMSQRIDIPDAAHAPSNDAECASLDSEPDQGVTVCSDQSRDSSFHIPPDGAIPAEPISVAARTTNTIPAPTGSQIAANEDVLLNAAAETGCRLFHRLGVVPAQQNPVQTASGSQQLRACATGSGDFCAATDCGLADGSLAAADPAVAETKCMAAAECCGATTCENSALATCDKSTCDGTGQCNSTMPCETQPACDSKSSCDSAVQTCQLKNRKTNQPLATLAMSSTNTTRLTAEEIAEMAPPSGYASEFDVTPSLRVVQNEYTQAWEIEARNIELPELIEQLANYCPHPIVCGQDVRGTVSAKVSAYSIDEALHRLVTPFGFKIGRSDVGIVVGALYQPSVDVHADYETTNVGTAQPTPAELDRLPPVLQAETFTAAETPTAAPATEATSVAAASIIRKSAEVVVDESELKVAHMAQQMIGRGDSAEAIQVIAAAVSAKPNSAFLFRILGEALAFQSEYEGAAAALESSIKLNKYDPLTSQLFSEVLSRMGQDRRAEHYAQLSRDVASGIVTAP